MKEYSEVVIGAFLSHFRIRDIAEASGLSERTVRRYKADPAFLSVLNERRAAIIGAAVDQMTESILQDKDVLQSIIGDPAVNPAVRVAAINTKWSHLREWRAMIDFEKRLSALESSEMASNGLFRPGGGTG
jgi:hypothetical protein